MTLITGNTYPVKDQLKALGGQWDHEARGWYVPDHRADEARAIVAAYRPRRRSRYVSDVARLSSGAVVFTNKRGRCEDAPCCGCCS